MIQKNNWQHQADINSSQHSQPQQPNSIHDLFGQSTNRPISAPPTAINVSIKMMIILQEYFSAIHFDFAVKAIILTTFISVVCIVRTFMIYQMEGI
jgi:hypothetical protein